MATVWLEGLGQLKNPREEDEERDIISERYGTIKNHTNSL
jgi:hypothetical protein